MLNIEEMANCTWMYISLSLSQNGLMFTMLCVVGIFQIHNVKEAKEEGPCGRGGARSGIHYQDRIHIQRHQMYMWCGARIPMGVD